MASKPPPEPQVQGQKPVTAQAGDVPLPETDQACREVLRSRMKDLIRHLDAETQGVAARQLAPQLAPFLRDMAPGHLASYFPVRGEIDPNGFTGLGSVGSPFGLHVYLPRLQGGSLEFVSWEPGTDLRPNRFGIPEPTTGHSLSPERLDAILLPLRAFDSWGRRLGTGGGFYDRTLAGEREGPIRPLRIGVAHDRQRVDSIPEAPWDVPLDWVVTDRGWYRNGCFHPSWPGLK